MHAIVFFLSLRGLQILLQHPSKTPAYLKSWLSTLLAQDFTPL